MATKECPVCHWIIEESATTVIISGEEITVCCEECADKLRTERRQRDIQITN